MEAYLERSQSKFSRERVSHGQLYVVVLRFTSRNRLKILMTDDDGNCNITNLDVLISNSDEKINITNFLTFIIRKKNYK